MDERSSQSLHATVEFLEDVIATGKISVFQISTEELAELLIARQARAKQHKALCDYLDSADQEEE
jgi:hypothetical protein